MKACLGTTFSSLPPRLLPFFVLCPLSNFVPPEDDHISYSVGRLKIQSLHGGGGGENERVPENGQNEGMSLGSFSLVLIWRTLCFD